MAEKSFNSPLMSQSNTSARIDFPRGSLLGSTKVVFHLGGRHVADIGEVHTLFIYIYIYMSVPNIYIYISITYTYYIYIHIM